MNLIKKYQNHPTRTIKKKLAVLTNQELDLKNELKRLETIYVNEMQLSLGEEFKSDNLKENREILEKKSNELKQNILEISKIISLQEKDYYSKKKLSLTFEDNIKKLHDRINQKKKKL